MKKISSKFLTQQWASQRVRVIGVVAWIAWHVWCAHWERLYHKDKIAKYGDDQSLKQALDTD